MKWFSHLASIAILVIASAASTAFAQTTANGPYYATPSWDQTLPSATRFIVLSNFGGQAVLDRETGLVWEKIPNTAPMLWEPALEYCINHRVGDRQGWRLPTMAELRSLVDPTATLPALPAGHPFTVLLGISDFYWSATLSRSGFVRGQNFRFAGNVIGANPATAQGLGWCVRGGSGPDV